MDALALAYGRSHNFLVSDCPALRLLFDRFRDAKLEERELWARIALAYEIKLNAVHALHELATVAGLENKHWIVGSGADPLESTAAFAVAMRRARAAFGVAIRTRAMYDKLFLYLAREADVTKFEKVASRKRSMRRAFFDTFAAGVGPFDSSALHSLRDDIERLEAEYRSPELHGHGAIRTWAFDPIGSWPVPQSLQLMGHWSTMNGALNAVFRDASSSITSIDDEPVWETERF